MVCKIYFNISDLLIENLKHPLFRNRKQNLAKAKQNSYQTGTNTIQSSPNSSSQCVDHFL